MKYKVLSLNGACVAESNTLAEAIHECCLDVGEDNLTREEELNWIDTVGSYLGYHVTAIKGE